MDDLKSPEQIDYNYIPGQAIEAASMRVCIICHDQITNAELKKEMLLGYRLAQGLGSQYITHVSQRLNKP